MERKRIKLVNIQNENTNENKRIETKTNFYEYRKFSMYHGIFQLLNRQTSLVNGGKSESLFQM